VYRLFVAITLAEPVRAALAVMCAGVAGAKWVAAENIHLTLRFIGEVDGGIAEDVHVALSQIQAPAFALTIAGIDCFAQGGKVHTLWAGIDKEPLLVHLRDKVESAIVRAGIEPERRKFKPHITLARLRNGTDERIGAYLQRHSRFRCGPFDVEQFALYRSHLSTAGAHYEVLAEYRLDKGRRPVPPPPAAPPRQHQDQDDPSRRCP
jgi:2'-5' RNA ligase